MYFKNVVRCTQCTFAYNCEKKLRKTANISIINDNEMTHINKKIVKNGWQNVDHLCKAIRAASMKKYHS